MRFQLILGFIHIVVWWRGANVQKSKLGKLTKNIYKTLNISRYRLRKGPNTAIASACVRVNIREVFSLFVYSGLAFFIIFVVEFIRVFRDFLIIKL